MKNSGEQFIHKIDSKLHTSQPVEHEKKRKKRADGAVSQKPADKLTDWFRVLERTHSHTDPAVNERIRQYYHKEHVIKPEDIPEGYFENQKRLAKELGHGEIEITDELRQQNTEVIISDQKSTLNNWVDYLSSSDSSSYPMWAKYWAFKNMVKLSSYDKEKKAFGKRDKGTVAPFPDLNREALAYVVDIIVKKANKEHIPVEQDNFELQNLIYGESFAKLYAYAIEKVTPTKEGELTSTKGKWVKYNKDSDHMPLVQSLQGHGTGWCTAGESTAQVQLQGGDFYVYYSYDKDNKPTVPRAAIRMQGDSIGEVRGIAKEQNLDPYISGVVKKKLAEFPDGKDYEKKTSDMNHLTQIDNKVKLSQPLTKGDLIFLYELDGSIEGFGYQKDPRIEEIRKTRNLQEDAPIVFNCAPNEIAYKQKDVNKNTKAYIGPLFSGIFTKNIEYIYTSFPEGKITKMETTIGGMNKEELIKELENNSRISDYAKQMMDNPDFIVSKKQEQIPLIKLTVKALGFPNGATTNEIYKRADELSLDLCPAETGPQLRLQFIDQPIGTWIYIGMKQISVAHGNPDVFVVCRGLGGSRWLSSFWAGPTHVWRPGPAFVFRPRKLDA